MTFDEFDRIAERIVTQVRRMSETKGKEYSQTANRFDNFNRLAARLNLPRNKVLLVYLTKHLDAIESYVQNGQTYSSEPVFGRIVDAITYLMLLGGMIAEDEAQSPPPEPPPPTPPPTTQDPPTEAA
jgi:hypothetical protein